MPDRPGPTGWRGWKPGITLTHRPGSPGTRNREAIVLGLTGCGSASAGSAFPVITGGRHQRQGVGLRLSGSHAVHAAGYRTGLLYLAASAALQRTHPHRRPRWRTTPAWSRPGQPSRRRGGESTRSPISNRAPWRRMWLFQRAAHLDVGGAGSGAGRPPRRGQCLGCRIAPWSPVVDLDHQQFLGNDAGSHRLREGGHLPPPADPPSVAMPEPPHQSAGARAGHRRRPAAAHR
jgi:hypothetical protein